MAESKMKEVAKILGVELEEEFKIKGYDRTFKFTNDGLFDCYSCNISLTLLLLLNGKCEIEKPILDKVEKRYLKNLLRPFKDIVMYIEKRNNCNQQYLHIHLKTYEFIQLPNFEKNTMYKGMEPNKQYTLKELGLFE